MKHTVIIILIISLMVMAFTSCDNFLDVNTDPNNPTSVPENLILTGVLSRHAFQIVGGFAARHGVKWSQQIAWAAAVPPTWDNYDLLEGGAEAPWFQGYANVIKNAIEMEKLAVQNENYAYAGIAKIITAWTLSVLTDTYGDIPWSEALDPIATTQPKYDSQRDVYEAIFTMLQEAIQYLDQPSRLTPTVHDLVYNGNMANWRRLAYSLMARYHMRLTYAPGESRTARAQQALNVIPNGFTSNAHNARFAYVDAPGQRNPWHQFAISGQWDDRDRLSYHYVQLLKSLNDPRLPIQARPTPQQLPDGTFFGGHVNGLPGGQRDTVSQIGRYYSDPDAPLYLFHYPELKFIEAEAVLYVTGPAAADPVFRAAVTAHMEKLGVAPAEITTYVDNLPDLGAMSPEDALEQIMTQKYIANFLSPEVWVDWRRTNIPRLTPVTHEARLDEIPRRFPYPLSEWQYNAQNVQATGVPLGYSSMKSRVWWDPN